MIMITKIKMYDFEAVSGLPDYLENDVNALCMAMTGNSYEELHGDETAVSIMTTGKAVAAVIVEAVELGRTEA